MRVGNFLLNIKILFFEIFFVFIFNNNSLASNSIYKTFKNFYFVDIGTKETLNIKFELYKYRHLKKIFKRLSQEEIMYLNVFLNNVTSSIPELKKRQNILKEFIKLIRHNKIEYNTDFLLFNNPYFDSLLDLNIENLTNKQITTRLQRLSNLIKKLRLITEILEKNEVLSEIFENEIIMFYNLIEGNTNDDLLNLTIDYIKKNKMKEEICAKNYVRKKYVNAIIQNYDYFVKIIYHLSKIMFYLKIAYNIIDINKRIQFVNFKINIDKQFIENEKIKIYNELINESYTIIFPKSQHDNVILKHFYKSIENVPYNSKKLKENAFLALVFGFVFI